MLALYLREIIFGFEDSFVSTVGTVTGIAAGTHDARIVLLSGSVLVVVEAISMAAGSYLSSKTQEEVEATHRHRYRTDGQEHPVVAGGIMGLSYLVGGAIPLLPYLFLEPSQAMRVSLLVTIALLFALGAWKTRFTKRSPWRSGFEMVVVCAVAAALGYAIGQWLG